MMIEVLKSKIHCARVTEANLNYISIMIARNKKTKEHIRIVNLLKYTNENVLPFSEDIQIGRASCRERV